LLRADVRNRIITDNMTYKEVFPRRPQFAYEADVQNALHLFEGRLTAARNYVRKKELRAAQELALMQADRTVYPIEDVMYSGEPRWEGSLAQQYLKEDVAAGLHKTMTRTQFFESREAYQDFAKKTIDGHVEQEERTEKFLKQYRARYGIDNDYNSDDGARDEDDEEEDDDDYGDTDDEESD